MRVFVAGANGALGVPLTRLLVARGHRAVGLIRDPAGVDRVRELGAHPIVADALDRDGLLRAVNGLTADAVIHAQMRAMLQRRGVPVSVGGLLGWVHHLDAAAATVSALEVGRAGHAYNVVDDQSATWEQLFTAMAAAVGAPPPRRLPRWLTRLVAPYAARVAVDTSMRVSNAKARKELAWQPRFTTYREGIAAMASDLGREDPNLPRVPADRLQAGM